MATNIYNNKQNNYTTKYTTSKIKIKGSVRSQQTLLNQHTLFTCTRDIDETPAMTYIHKNIKTEKRSKK